MKRVLLATTLALSSLAVPAQAEPQQTIAVIDSGFNPAVVSNVSYEVCMVEFYWCPNGKPNQEGPGAATVTSFKDEKFNHGTQMISIINQVAPTASVIAIRITPLASNGTSYVTSPAILEKALAWVVANRVKYNIKVVSLSMGYKLATCNVSPSMAGLVTTLKTANVPLVAATGNDNDYTMINSPACIGDSVAVGATDFSRTSPTFISNYSNSSPAVDFYAPGYWTTIKNDGSKSAAAGTSNSTAALAAWWFKNNTGDYNTTYSLAAAKALPAKGAFNRTGLVVIP